MVVEEEVAIDGIVFDHFLDDVLRLGDSANLAEAMRDAPVPIRSGTVERAGKALSGFIENFQRSERSVLHVDLVFQA